MHPLTLAVLALCMLVLLAIALKKHFLDAPHKPPRKLDKALKLNSLRDSYYRSQNRQDHRTVRSISLDDNNDTLNTSDSH